jgi:GT2 family glycosyltransferase
MADYPKVYIIVLNWNNWRDTIECLESVYQSSYPNFQVICVDNDSRDDSIEKIKDWAAGKLVVESKFLAFDTSNKAIPVVMYDRETAEQGGDFIRGPKGWPLCNGIPPPLILIASEANMGFAGGNNVGLRYVLKKGDGSFIWILNNDTVVNKNALAEVVKVAGGDHGIGMIGSKLLRYDKPNTFQLAGGGRITPWLGNSKPIASDQENNGDWDEPFDPDYICGASLFIKEEVVETIGLMDERYFLYWEDVDWGLRAREKHYRLLYCPESIVYHKEGGTAGRVTRATDYYWVRNGLFFIKKFYPAFLPLIPFSYFIKFTIIRLLRRKPFNLTALTAGILDFVRGKTGEKES